MTTGIPFGDPRHPYKQTTANASAAGRKGAAASPWRKTPMVVSKKADAIFAERARAKEKRNHD